MELRTRQPRDGHRTERPAPRARPRARGPPAAPGVAKLGLRGQTDRYCIYWVWLLFSVSSQITAPLPAPDSWKTEWVLRQERSAAPGRSPGMGGQLGSPLARRKRGWEEKEGSLGGGGNVTLSQGDASLQDGHPVGPGLTPEVRPLLWAGASEGTPLEPRGGVGAAEHQGAPPTAVGGVATGGWGGDGAGHGATVLWIAFLSVGFSLFSVFNSYFFKFLFYFLQIEIHPPSVFIFYFMSLFRLFVLELHEQSMRLSVR